MEKKKIRALAVSEAHSLANNGLPKKTISLLITVAVRGVTLVAFGSITFRADADALISLLSVTPRAFCGIAEQAFTA